MGVDGALYIHILVEGLALEDLEKWELVHGAAQQSAL
jgi:hypothetical protein